MYRVGAPQSAPAASGSYPNRQCLPSGYVSSSRGPPPPPAQSPRYVASYRGGPPPQHHHANGNTTATQQGPSGHQQQTSFGGSAQQQWQHQQQYSNGSAPSCRPRSTSGSAGPYPAPTGALPPSSHDHYAAPSVDVLDPAMNGGMHGSTSWTANESQRPPYVMEEGHHGDDHGHRQLTHGSRSNSCEDISSRTGSEETITTSSGASGSTEHSRKRVRLTSEERIQRSRERNRVHARKTRKRKKVQMESIQCMIENLQEEARRMRLAVMEWYTANILLVMRSPDGQTEASNASDKNLLTKYMRVQAFLERNNQVVKGEGSDDSGSTKDDPDGRTSSESTLDDEEQELLQPVVQHPWNKGTTRTRCKYAPEDRERIRRERNRIHAKRTRDRRKKFMEDSEKILGRLATENAELRDLLFLVYDQNPNTGNQDHQQPSQKGMDRHEEDDVKDPTLQQQQWSAEGDASSGLMSLTMQPSPRGTTASPHLTASTYDQQRPSPREVMLREQQYYRGAHGAMKEEDDDDEEGGGTEYDDDDGDDGGDYYHGDDYDDDEEEEDDGRWRRQRVSEQQPMSRHQRFQQPRSHVSV